MSNSATSRPAAPPTVWSARGRHTGPAAADAVRRHLEHLTADGTLHSHLEPEDVDRSREHVFEARWPAPGEVTVRARLALTPVRGGHQQWLLTAEAEAPWDPRWPSPATMFWPREQAADWANEAGTGLRLGDVNPLPEDDKDLRRILRHAVRDPWCVHVVVHEAMTPDERGLACVLRSLPESLRHRVVEHRAAPHRFRAVNWVLDDFDIRVPRGGAVVLPGSPPPAGYDREAFLVRSVFLDGSEPAELLDAVTRFAALPRPLPPDGEQALTALREQWHLRTVEEELARARELVAMYAEALEAMTRSRDLYREAAERANEALAAYREAEESGTLTVRRPGRPAAGSPFQQLARGLGRLKETALSLRPGGTAEPAPSDSAPAPAAPPVPQERTPADGSEGSAAPQAAPPADAPPADAAPSQDAAPPQGAADPQDGDPPRTQS
ncbi:hypothetical protein [Streptomyces thermodiastaticus]|jgi:hypothetical protein|uniref:hypothetical protein n=1 Tax=Streptomyces thermodiastaticus TaxID=44061 RepID=UPI001674E537|nr:hypothetical protein [Streptomyces thermodiastaticus]MCE7553016.1 hypothetical protein [Streptomyces thermodiastaticus]GHF84696.1 hypothetical protein GCM10018787_36920 [Streptomyces thermodiastaticus]